jgi:hypothetical protein
MIAASKSVQMQGKECKSAQNQAKVLKQKSVAHFSVGGGGVCVKKPIYGHLAAVKRMKYSETRL